MSGLGRNRRHVAALAIAVGLAAIAVSLGLALSCRTHSAPAQREIVVWRNLGSWSAHGPSQTEAFIGNTGMLRLRWEARNEAVPGTGTLRVTVHSAVSGRPLVLVVDHRGIGQDTAYVNEDPREFYLVVDSSHLEWTVEVDEGISARAPEPATSKPSRSSRAGRR